MNYVGMPGLTSRLIRVPDWFLVLLTGSPLCCLLGYKRRTRLRRLRKGLCLHCGYDLRAHKPGQKCPECGTLIPTSPSPTPAP